MKANRHAATGNAERGDASEMMPTGILAGIVTIAIDRIGLAGNVGHAAIDKRNVQIGRAHV